MELNQQQAVSIAAFMTCVAHVDGLHPQEQDLISAFTAGVEFELVKALKEDTWVEALSGEVAALAVKMAFLTGLCDGHLTEDESEYVTKTAIRLGLSPEAITNARIEAKAMLLSCLDNQHDSTVLSVAQEL